VIAVSLALKDVEYVLLLPNVWHAIMTIFSIGMALLALEKKLRYNFIVMKLAIIETKRIRNAKGVYHYAKIAQIN
jgi:hypothetical protein